jgi:hypothetical protein
MSFQQLAEAEQRAAEWLNGTKKRSGSPKWKKNNRRRRQ